MAAASPLPRIQPQMRFQFLYMILSSQAASLYAEQEESALSILTLKAHALCQIFRGFLKSSTSITEYDIAKHLKRQKLTHLETVTLVQVQPNPATTKQN